MKILIILIIILFPIIISNAQNPIEFVSNYCAGDRVESISYCLQGIYNLGVALAVMIAFFMFLVGAFRNLLSAVPDIKVEGKTLMRNSIVGLIVIFLSGSILYWINPAIFDPRIIIYQVTKLNVITSINQLKELKGTEYDIGKEFEEHFPILKKAIEGAELDFSQLPNNTTVKKYIEIAFNYANNNDGRKNYANKYGTTATSLTACNLFVYQVLKEATAVPDTCQPKGASEFHNLLTNTANQNHAKNYGFEWQIINFNINDLKPGDILVKTKLSRGGHGHVAIVVPVKSKDNNTRLIIAHASLSTRKNDDGTYSGSPPRLTPIPADGFQKIVRPKIIQ